MKFHEIFKTIRLSCGLSQEFMAERLNVDASAISNIEAGRREVKVRELAIIADAFAMSVQDLVGFPNKYQVIQGEFGGAQEEVTKVTLSIELKKEKKDQVLKLVFGDNNIEILNK